MPLTIQVDADVSAARAAIDRLVSDARAQRVVVGGSFAGSAASGIVGNSSTPTVASVFGASAGIASGSAFGQIAPLASSPFTAGVSANSIFGYPGSAQSAVGGGTTAISSPQGATVVVAGASSAGGGGGGSWLNNIFGSNGGGGGGYSGAGGGSFSGSFAGRGFGRLVGAGFLLRAAETTIGAERQYAIDSALAGSSQRGQLEAIMGLRQKLQGAVPIVGNLLGDINDITGSGQLGVEGTVRSADAQEARMGITRQAGRDTQQLRYEAAAAGIDSTLEREDLAAGNEHRLRRQRIDDAATAAAAADEKRLAADDAVTASSRSRRIVERFTSKRAGNLLLDPDQATADEIDAEDRANSADARSKAAAARDRTFAEQYGLEDSRFAAEGAQRNRERARSNLLTSQDLGSSTRESAGAAAVYRAISGHEPADDVARLKLENSLNERQDAANQARLKVALDPNANLHTYVLASQRADAVSDENQAARDAFEQTVRDRKYNESNQYADRLAALDIDNQTLNAGLKNQPLNARLSAVESRRRAALQDVDPFADADEFDRTNEKFNKIRELERKDYDFDKTLSLHTSEARGRLLQAELGGGRFADIAGAATSIKENALLRVEALSKDPSGNRAEIQQVLKNAQLEEAQLAKNFNNRFRPEEIDINRASLTGGAGNSEITDLLKQIADSNKIIADKLNLTAQ